MACYESFAEVKEDFYCSAVDVLKILVLRLHDYHARCFHSLRDALYLSLIHILIFSTDSAFPRCLKELQKGSMERRFSDIT